MNEIHRQTHRRTVRQASRPTEIERDRAGKRETEIERKKGERLRRFEKRYSK